MTIYCDESGGVGAGIMCLSAVSIPADAADELLQQMRAVIGVRGELKGSRITLPERAYCIELLMRLGGKAVIACADIATLRRHHDGKAPEDIALYAHLLETALDPWMLESGGCIDVRIDDGRYDPRLNAMLRADVQQSLGQWGKATLEDSRRSAGIQIADVMANSWYQIGLAGPRSQRIRALMEPFVADGRIRPLIIQSAPDMALPTKKPA